LTTTRYKRDLAEPPWEKEGMSTKQSVLYETACLNGGGREKKAKSEDRKFLRNLFRLENGGKRGRSEKKGYGGLRGRCRERRKRTYVGGELGANARNLHVGGELPRWRLGGVKEKGRGGENS